MNIHQQYPRTWSATKRVVVSCKCGVQEYAYVRGAARPRLCSACSKPVKSNARAVAA